jgi:hypothetical protein
MRAARAVLIFSAIALCVSCGGDSSGGTPGGPGGPGASDGSGSADAPGGPDAADIPQTPSSLKLDLVWVIDDSTTLCQEQANVGRTFERFLSGLRASGRVVDLRTAVVRTDVLSGRAQFNAEPRLHGAACRVRSVKPCLTHAECISSEHDHPPLPEAPGQSTWNCSWSQTDPKWMMTENGSVATRCSLICDSDEACHAVYGPDYSCRPEGGLVSEPGCWLPPTPCPSLLPSVIQVDAEIDNAFLFECVAQVGTGSSYTADLEQGLNAALLSIEPSGPNAEQSQAILREDAALLVVFLSDEDDCSLKRDCLIDSSTGTWKDAILSESCLGRGQYHRCAFVGDTTAGGPLVSVSEYADAFRALKKDSSKVLVAAIVGDSQKTTDADRETDINFFKQAKSSSAPLSEQSYICKSENGVADHGGRYLELVKLFGPRGLAVNICGPTPCTRADGSLGVTGARDCEPFPAGSSPRTIAFDTFAERLTAFVLEQAR